MLNNMSTYEHIRQQYQPKHTRVLLIAESPPPAATVASSRHFYRSDRIRSGDRLFINTIKALYPEAADVTEVELEQQKEQWLRRFQADGCFMVEALEVSQPHSATKQERQERIRQALPRLIERIARVADTNTRLVLIKSNVFEVAAGPLRQAGFRVLNTKLVDYPGQFNQRAYREKLAALVKE